jgi:RND family efflux transporter MFP subunit
MKANILYCLGAIGLAPCLATAADFPAELDWAGRVALAMPVSGVVARVAAQPGQSLKKGELMAALDSTEFKADVAEAQAEQERLVQEQADAKRDLDRVQELYARTVSATTELDAAKLRHARASAALAAARARLEKARHRLEEAELRAPFDAIVLTRTAEPGLVAATPCQPNPLFTVAHSDELVAHASLTASQAAAVSLGRKAEVIAAGASYKGVVSGISASGHGNYSLEVVIPRASRLMAGQAARIRLP